MIGIFRSSAASALQPQPPRFALGLMVGLVGVLIYSAPRMVGGFAMPIPIISLIPVYIWALARPGTPAIGLVAVMGLMCDIVRDDPLGVWTMGFVVAYAAANFQAPVLAGQSRTALIAGFGITAVAFGAGTSLAMLIALGAGPAMGRLALDLAVTVALSPLLALLCGGFDQAALLAGERQ